MGTNINSDTTTNNVRIQVFPEFVQEHSDTDNNLFYFKYKIIITNNSDVPLTLISRHWEIINSEGDTEVVDGPGVIGKTPYLDPGEDFEYESYCPLDTSWGTMEGSYCMQDDEGNTFEVEIGRFYLCIPVTA